MKSPGAPHLLTDDTLQNGANRVMPLPPRDFQRIGPTEGERFPDVRLPDQTGAVIDLHHARDGRRALIVFYRSAEW
jgi:hypothetical protein